MQQFLLWFFVLASLAGGVLMLVLRHPMRVALALANLVVTVVAVWAIRGAGA